MSRCVKLCHRQQNQSQTLHSWGALEILQHQLSPMHLVSGHSAQHLSPFLCKAGYALALRAETSHFFSMPWTSAVFSLSLPGCTLDLCLKIPDPSMLAPLGADAVICLCTLYSHYNTGCFAARKPKEKKKNHCLSLPCVPWFPGLPQDQCLHGCREAPFAPACWLLSVQLVMWDAAALSSYHSSLITVGLSPALQRPEKTPGRSDNTSECRDHGGLCCSLLWASLGFIYAFLNHTVSTQHLNRIKEAPWHV